jgi:Uma2 family endonuclease
MTLTPWHVLSPDVLYPSSEHWPVGDNARQLRSFVTLYGNLTALFREAPNVVVGGNQFWYPVEGKAELKVAPDMYVVLGRPKGERASYQQWKEGSVPLTVVFDILSRADRHAEMTDKLQFYEEYGVAEYYLYDPDSARLFVYLKAGETLKRLRSVSGFVSPRLGIRFDTSGPELVVFRPDGQRFRTFEELDAACDKVEERAARLAELSRKARRQQITPEELAELEQLEEQGPSPP